MRLKITPAFRDNAINKFGISATEAKHTFLKPDAEQELVVSDGPTLLFFARAVDDADDPHRILLHGRKIGNDFMADFGWVIYPDLHENIDSLSPVQLLDALTARFGMEVEVGSVKGRLLYSQSTLVDRPPTIDDLVPEDRSRSWISSTFFRFVEQGSRYRVDFALVFMIDVERYLDWLEDG